MVTIPCKTLDWYHWSIQTTCANTTGRGEKIENTLKKRDKNSARDKYISRHWVIQYIGGLGGELWQISTKKSIPKKHQTMNLFPSNWYTSSTRPAIDIDIGQISTGSSTSLNYDKVRMGLCPHTNNASDTNDSMFHHCSIVTRPTCVPCAFTTIFVIAGRQGLHKTYTRLHKNKLIVIDVNQQQSPRYLSISTEAWAMKTKGIDSVLVAHFAKKNMWAHKFCLHRFLA